ncbi:hypothetical protein ACFFGH_30995 [Lysobacter korlensis]|uniref:Uncharacterized protein n=1 Tax=Lysobacter korlensis TaxID=553636 RepID=A0ABV6RZ78_9GAMM
MYRADNVLQFWDEGRSDDFGGGLHIRARDGSVYVGSADGVDGNFAQFPNQAVPGECFYCWSAPADPDSTGTYPNREQDIWVRIRGPVFYEVDVNLEGDACNRVSQEPIWYAETG